MGQYGGFYEKNARCSERRDGDFCESAPKPYPRHTLNEVFDPVLDLCCLEDSRAAPILTPASSHDFQEVSIC